MKPKVTVELPRLGELTTVEEVKAGINTALDRSIKAKVFVSKANARGEKMAIVTLSSDNATPCC